MTGRRDRPPRLSAAILGAGQCFLKMLPGLRSFFGFRAIYDPNDSAVGLLALLPDEQRARVSSEVELLKRLSYSDALFILSPPGEHVRQVSSAYHTGKPIFVEKPLAVDESGLQELEVALNRNPHIYFSDFYADVRGSALVRYFGSHEKETEWITPYWTPTQSEDFCGLFEELGHIHSVRGTVREQSVKQDGLPARLWLNEWRQGGALLDLAYHCLTLYFTLFGDPLSLEKVDIAGSRAFRREIRPRDPSLGVNSIAETYAYLRLKSPSGLTFELEVNNRSPDECRRFHVTGSKGEAVMDFGSLRSRHPKLDVTAPGRTASYQLTRPYWDLVSLGFYEFISRAAGSPHGFEEGQRALRIILQARAMQV